MRPNVRMTSDELLLAQVMRAQELRHREVRDPLQADIEFAAYLVTFGIVLTGILLVLAL